LRLPGTVGPLRALTLAAAWFGAAAAVQLMNDLTVSASGWRWTFPGLELLLFLVAFSVAWDLCTLKEGTWKHALDQLRKAYRIQQTRAIARYVIPVLVAIITIGPAAGQRRRHRLRQEPAQPAAVAAPLIPRVSPALTRALRLFR
jgi:hypothetical protein